MSMDDTKLKPNDDAASRELIDSLVPTAIKRNPRLRPKVAKPRRTPLGAPGWRNAVKPKEPKRRRKQPEFTERIETPEDAANFLVNLEEKMKNEEEEEEEDIASEIGTQISYVESKNILYRDEENPGKINQKTETFYGIDCEEDIEDSDPDSEVEGIDYPDGECIDSDSDFNSDDDGDFDDY